jgi:hypothetical protein
MPKRPGTQFFICSVNGLSAEAVRHIMFAKFMPTKTFFDLRGWHPFLKGELAEINIFLETTISGTPSMSKITVLWFDDQAGRFVGLTDLIQGGANGRNCGLQPLFVCDTRRRSKHF